MLWAHLMDVLKIGAAALLAFNLFLVTACEPTPTRSRSRGRSYTNPDATPNSMGDAPLQNFDLGTPMLPGSDSGTQMTIKDATSTGNPDAGMIPTDCSGNPNQCVPHELIAPAPSCACLNRCESGWMWDSTTRSCVEECPGNRLNMYPGSPCAAATFACMQNCDPTVNPNCQQDCLSNDPNPQPCNECINNNFIYCANNNGCQNDWDAYYCCIQANCPNDPASCQDTICANQSTAVDQCFDSAGSNCNAAIIACFMQ
jgi:hypothetical protein